MKRWGIFLYLCFAMAGVLHAQYTTLTANVQDSDGTNWVNGTWSIKFIPSPSNPNISVYNINGNALASSTLNQNGSMDGTGALSLTVYNSSQISPAGSSWQLIVCPNASASCGIMNFSTSSNSQNLSSSLTAIIPPVRFVAKSGSFGYSDNEALTQNTPGSMYFNVVSQSLRCFSAGAWGACNAGGGGGSCGSGCVSSTTTSPQSMAGALNSPGFNNIVSACLYPGTTADAKLTNALAAISAGGTVDARCFGATTQTWSAQIACGPSGIYHTLLFDPVTQFVPSANNINFINQGANCVVDGLTVALPAGMTYAGAVITNNSNTPVGSAANLRNITINAAAETSNDYTSGYGIYYSAADSIAQSIRGATINNVRCIGLLRCFYGTTSGSGTISTNHFLNIFGSSSGAAIEFNSNGSGGFQGNIITADSSGANLNAGPGILYSGSGPITGNTTTAKLALNTVGVQSTNTNAVGNYFIGSNDGTVSDTSSALSAFPNQNVYNFNGIFSSLPTGQVIINGGPTSWPGAKSGGILSYNYQSGGEIDYLTGTFTGAANFAHAFYTPNSGNTNYSLLGGFLQGGSFRLSMLSSALQFAGANQEIRDDSAGGYNINTTSSPTNGLRVWKGATGSYLLFQVNANGDIINHSGAVIIPAATAGSSGTGNVVLTNGPTLNNATCTGTCNGFGGLSTSPTIPATCSVGDTWTDPSASSAAKVVYECYATNTWIALLPYMFGTPTKVNDAGAGTGATSTFINATDGRGFISLTTGTSPTAGSPTIGVVTVSFSKTYPVAPNCEMFNADSDSNALTGAGKLFIDEAATTTTSFIIKVGTTALPASTNFILGYRCDLW